MALGELRLAVDWPISHALQKNEPVLLLYVPLGQSMQDNAPSVGANFPGSHASQGCPPVIEKVPAIHAAAAEMKDVPIVKDGGVG